MQSHVRQPPRFRDVAWAMLYVWKQGAANLPFDVPFEVWACILNQLVGRDFQLCGAIGCTNIGQRTCSGCKSARYCEGLPPCLVSRPPASSSTYCAGIRIRVDNIGY